MNKNTAIKNLNALNAVLGNKDFYDKEFEEAIKVAKEAINSQKTGQWEYVQYDANPKIGNLHCSECRFIPIGQSKRTAFAFQAYVKENYKFCPNCGAKMEVANETVTT